MRSFIVRALILTLTLFNSHFIHGVNPSSYLDPLYKVGDYDQGGVIFFVTPDGNHGLVASINDISAGAAWGLASDYVGALSNYIQFGENYTTAGKLNTQLIVDKYPSGSYAANLCKNYSVKMNGITYNDWYLPCLKELGLMMAMQETINSISVAHGGTAIQKNFYWSSFEAYSSAWSQSFNNAGQTLKDKGTLYRVRAVRAF